MALSRRVAGHEFQSRAYQRSHPKAGTGEIRRLLHGRPHGRAQHADGCAQAQPHVDLVRAVHAALGAVAGDRAYRPCRHRLDHVRCAVSHRAAFCLARLSEQRPRRLEHRHHVQSGRCAQFRARRAHGARRPLSPRARILRRRDRAMGQLGGRRVHSRRRGRHFLRSGENARAQSQGQISFGARPAQYRAAGPGLAGDRAGRRLGFRPAACRRNGGSRVHGAKRSRRRPAVLCRRQRPHGKARPLPRVT